MYGFVFTYLCHIDPRICVISRSLDLYKNNLIYKSYNKGELTMITDAFALLGCALTATSYGVIVLQAYKSYVNSDS